MCIRDRGDPFNHQEAMRILEATYDSGVNFIDTADIYNDGNSEKAIGELLKKYPDHFYVVTKCGRGLDPHEMCIRDRVMTRRPAWFFTSPVTWTGSAMGRVP